MLTLRNESAHDLYHGEAYVLARRDGAAWIELDPFDPEPGVAHAWVLVGFTLPPGGTSTDTIDLPRHLRPGRHRLGKTWAGI